MIGTVKIDTKTVRAVARRHYNFTVIWNEPFANFDPIVNYTVNIGCTNAATCPVIVNTNNATRADVSVITNLAASYKITTLSVTATNTIGTSDPAISVIGGKLHMYFMYMYVYVHTYVQWHVRMCVHSYRIYVIYVFVCKSSFCLHAYNMHAHVHMYICMT